jgi:hypothetical protein
MVPVMVIITVAPLPMAVQRAVYHFTAARKIRQEHADARATDSLETSGLSPRGDRATSETQPRILNQEAKVP